MACDACETSQGNEGAYKMTRAEIDELADRRNCHPPVLEGYDPAISEYKDVGRAFRVVYDYEKCIGILMARDGMTREIAEEYFEYNALGAIPPGDDTLFPLIQHAP